MKAIRIPVEGPIEWIECTSLIDTGEFTHQTVVTCRSPHLSETIHVGILDDFGAQESPLNMRAWALYGRGPIHGTMILGRDDGMDVRDDIYEIISEPIEKWVAADTRRYMADSYQRPEMIMERPNE